MSSTEKVFSWTVTIIFLVPKLWNFYQKGQWPFGIRSLVSLSGTSWTMNIMSNEVGLWDLYEAGLWDFCPLETMEYTFLNIFRTKDSRERLWDRMEGIKWRLLIISQLLLFIWPSFVCVLPSYSSKFEGLWKWAERSRKLFDRLRYIM